MMIRNTWPALVFIKCTIIAIRCLTPLTLLYLVTRFILVEPIISLHWTIDVYVSLEAAFYVLVFVPRYYYLQNVTASPTAPPREQRQRLFKRCLDTIPSPGRFLTMWGGVEDLCQLRRENVKTWLAWAFLNKQQQEPGDQEELEQYLHEVETLDGDLRIRPGRSPAQPLRVSIDQVAILHRPLIYYAVGITGSDLISYLFMRSHGYTFYPLQQWFTSIPCRPWTLLSKHRSPAAHLAYWHLPHTSKTRLPILYIHGIGVLHTYLQFFAELKQTSEAECSDGSVGVIVLDLMPISFRMTHTALSADELCAEIRSILDMHGWNKFTLLANSFGTAISACLLKTQKISPRVGNVVFIDPVVFLLHLPDMTHNFTRRKPVSASEYQLWYFACTDIGAAHTLARCFSWSEHIMWKEDLVGRQWTIVLSEKDIIVDAENLGRYLTRKSGMKAIEDKRGSEWKSDLGWISNNVNAILLPGLNHAESFDFREPRAMIIATALEYCKAV